MKYNTFELNVNKLKNTLARRSKNEIIMYYKTMQINKQTNKQVKLERKDKGKDKTKYVR